MIIVNGGSAVIKNNKTVEDTYSTKAIVDSISSSVQ
ncbi:formate/nitrite transporter, partial [Staphylococcus epidermidis]